MKSINDLAKQRLAELDSEIRRLITEREDLSQRHEAVTIAMQRASEHRREWAAALAGAEQPTEEAAPAEVKKPRKRVPQPPPAKK